MLSRKKRFFKDKTVVVTGAAGGMGRAFCHRFARAGSKVVLIDIDQNSLDNIGSELLATGADTLSVCCDITNEEACTAAFDKIFKKYGGVDLLLNNAGVSHRSSFIETDLAVFRKVMEVNYFGSLICTRAAINSLLEHKGMVVVISSIAGFSPLYGRTGYSAAKHALHGLFDSLRSEVKEKGVDVLVVCPGFTDTGIAGAALDVDGERTEHPQSTVGRIATPEEVAESVFRAAESRQRLLVLSGVGKLTRLITKVSPALHEFLMVRSLRAELDR